MSNSRGSCLYYQFSGNGFSHFPLPCGSPGKPGLGVGGTPLQRDQPQSPGPSTHQYCTRVCRSQPRIKLIQPLWTMFPWSHMCQIVCLPHWPWISLFARVLIEEHSHHKGQHGNDVQNCLPQRWITKSTQIDIQITSIIKWLNRNGLADILKEAAISMIPKFCFTRYLVSSGWW